MAAPVSLDLMPAPVSLDLMPAPVSLDDFRQPLVNAEQIVGRAVERNPWLRNEFSNRAAFEVFVLHHKDSGRVVKRVLHDLRVGRNELATVAHGLDCATGQSGLRWMVDLEHGLGPLQHLKILRLRQRPKLEFLDTGPGKSLRPEPCRIHTATG